MTDHYSVLTRSRCEGAPYLSDTRSGFRAEFFYQAPALVERCLRRVADEMLSGYRGQVL